MKSVFNVPYQDIVAKLLQAIQTFLILLYFTTTFSVRIVFRDKAVKLATMSSNFNDFQGTLLTCLVVKAFMKGLIIFLNFQFNNIPGIGAEHCT